MHGEASLLGGEDIPNVKWSFVRNGSSFLLAPNFVALFIFSIHIGCRDGPIVTALINAWTCGALSSTYSLEVRWKACGGLMTSGKFDVKLSSLRHTFVFEPHILGARRLAMEEVEGTEHRSTSHGSQHIILLVASMTLVESSVLVTYFALCWDVFTLWQLRYGQG